MIFCGMVRTPKLKTNHREKKSPTLLDTRHRLELIESKLTIPKMRFYFLIVLMVLFFVGCASINQMAPVGTAGPVGLLDLDGRAIVLLDDSSARPVAFVFVRTD